ncbi:MAG: hypothetical protein Q7S07_03370 [Candidatus Omnitrophota bacterium]|nr:hypothetical protein [Candidatus Omnitrophota bacterium]
MLFAGYFVIEVMTQYLKVEEAQGKKRERYKEKEKDGDLPCSKCSAMHEFLKTLIHHLDCWDGTLN